MHASCSQPACPVLWQLVTECVPAGHTPASGFGATTLASGDQIATISSLAYLLASTLGIVTTSQLTARVVQGSCMYFVGLDLAWGDKNQTGVAAIDSDGRLHHVGAAQDDASIIDAIGPETFTYREFVTIFGRIIGRELPIISVAPELGY